MSLPDDSKDVDREYVPSDPISHFDFHLSNAVVASTRETDFSERKNASPVIGRIT